MTTRPCWLALSALFVAACGGGSGPALDNLSLRATLNPETPGAFGVAVSGNHAYVNTTYGAMVVALNGGADAAVVGTLESTPRVFDRARAVAVSGHHFFSAHSTRVDVIDVSTPSAPKAVAQLTGTGLILDLEVVGTRLYVADESAGVTAWDISTPSAPTLLATVLPGPAYGLAADEGHVYVINSGVLTVVTITNGAYATTGTVTYGTGGGNAELELSGTTLFVSATMDLSAFDVSDPAKPTLVTPVSFGIPYGRGGGADLVGSRFFTAQDRGDVAVFDVSDRATWKLAGYVVSAAPRPIAYDVAVTDRFVLVAHGEGLLVFGP